MPRLSPATSARAVRAQRDPEQPAVGDPHDADRGRAAHQGGEQVAARLQRVVDRHALAREQQRAVEVGLDKRLRAEPLRHRGPRLVARGTALIEEQHGGHAGEDQQDGGGAEQGAQAPVGAPRAARLALAVRDARLDERALELVELGAVPGAPVERRGEARTAVEIAGIAPAAVPLARRDRQVAVQAPPVGVLLEPAAQPRPLAQQRLVGDLRGPRVDQSRAGRPRARRALRGRRRGPRRARRAGRAAARRRAPASSPARRSRIDRATVCCAGSRRS